MEGKSTRYRGRVLRRGRYSETSRIYLVTSVTANREPLFREFDSARAVVGALKRESPRADTLCYVVMPDHLHWLLQLSKGDLSRSVAAVKASSSRRINEIRGSKAKVWQRGYHDRALRREEDLRTVARYVIANPLRAGIVHRLGDYPFWDAVWLGG